MPPKEQQFRKERQGPRGRTLRERAREADLDQEVQNPPEVEPDEIEVEWQRWLGKKEQANEVE